MREPAEKVIEKLHDAGLVFGELRTPNVLFSGGKGFLIDSSGPARFASMISKVSESMMPCFESNLVLISTN